VSSTLALQHKITKRPELAIPGFDEALARLNIATGAVHTKESLRKDRPSQHQLTSAVEKAKWARMREEAVTTQRKAHLDGVSRPHAGAYLEAIPMPNTPNCMSSRMFRVALKLRLGLPQFPEPRTTPSDPSKLIPFACPFPKCAEVLDINGTHALTCKAKGDSIFRHNDICSPIFAKARAAHLNAMCEVTHLFPGSGRRPGDIVIENFENDRTLILDVTVVNSQCVACRTAAPMHANFAEFAIAQADKRKDVAVLKFCENNNKEFLPLVVESYGGWSEGAQVFFEDLVQRHVQANGRVFSRQLAYFYQTLSLTLQRNNARIFFFWEVCTFIQNIGIKSSLHRVLAHTHKHTHK
jgi:hypothetical protein